MEGCRKLGQTYHWSRDESLSLYLDEFLVEAEAALRDRFYEMTISIGAIELGLGRTLARLFSKKNLPELPSWNEFQKGSKGDFDEELWWKVPRGGVDGDGRD